MTERIPRAVAVVIDGPRVLVIKRFRLGSGAGDCTMCQEADGPCPGHHYAVLPGGHVEDGETSREAAERELQEEATLAGTAGRQVFQGSHGGRPADYFLMTGVTGTPKLGGPELGYHRPGNSFELCWATAAELAEMGLRPPEIRPLLAGLLGGGAG